MPFAVKVPSGKMLRIATRQSALALWQANYVAELLQCRDPGLAVTLVKITSRGDQLIDSPLAKIGGKGLFVKELEQALLTDRADIAVHSMKDIPMLLPEDLHIPVICQREDPRDVFVSNLYDCVNSLPQGAVVGTSSLRRQCQLLALRADLDIQFVRGNVDTRLSKLDKRQYDGIILAGAGLIRLGRQQRIKSFLSTKTSLPSAGQGAIGIEICRHRSDLLEILQPLHHEPTAVCVEAERTVSRVLNGSCHVPVASFATLEKDHLYLRALVGQPDGQAIVRTSISENKSDHIRAGIRAAQDLLDQGAGEILRSLA